MIKMGTGHTSFFFYTIVAGLITSAVPLQAQETKHLYVLHTSDTHSRIEPFPADSPNPDAGLGGVARKAAFIKEYRKQHPGALLLDCGDISQGTPYYNMYKGEVEIRAMNLMEYDAMAIGNHEFDYGMENLARVFRMAEFPIVCANYDFTGTPLESLVRPYVVLERNGLRIGIFGLGHKLDGLVLADKCKGVVYHNPVMVAKKVVKELRKQEGCDVVICLSHLGYWENAPASDIYDNNMIGQLRGIDLILGGHTHTNMKAPAHALDADGHRIPIMHVGKNGAYVGVLDLTLKEKK